MAVAETQNFGYGSAAFSQFAFSGNELTTYAVLSGNGITASIGSPTVVTIQIVTPSTNVATFSAGSVTPYPGTYTTDAAFAEFAFGAEPFAGTNVETYVIPSGSTSSFSIGTLTITGTGLITPTGSAATFSIGNATIVSTYTVTGESATFSVGSTTVTAGALVTPTGSAGTFSIGSVVIESAYTPTGSSATFSIGNTTVTGTAVVNLTGSAATFSAGTLAFSIWNKVDDDASNTWTTVSKA